MSRALLGGHRFKRRGANGSKSAFRLRSARGTVVEPRDRLGPFEEIDCRLIGNEIR